MKRTYVIVLALVLPAVTGAQETSRDPVVTECMKLDTSSTWRQVARAWSIDTNHSRRIEPLRRELLEMRTADQKLRELPAISDSMRSASFLHRMAAEDSLRGARLKQLVEKYGWPGKSIAGEDGATSAFLIVQHNGFLQGEMLELMKRQPAGEVSPADLAMLEDRFNVQQGRPQRFGSQLKSPGEKTIEYYPIEDIAGVEARRAAAGLIPLSVYSCIIGKRFNLTVVTPQG